MFIIIIIIIIVIIIKYMRYAGIWTKVVCYYWHNQAIKAPFWVTHRWWWYIQWSFLRQFTL